MKLAALCGSLRKGSLNAALIEAVAGFGLCQVERVSTILPPFDPDLADDAPADVVVFREGLRRADAILISAPEYAMGIPGVLKNAIDWTVGSCEFAHKPTALITCSALGEIAHQAMLEILRVLEARITRETTLLMSHNRTKIRSDGTIIDAEAERQTRAVIEALIAQLAPTD